MGMAASMGSFLLMAGEPGQRIALPNARIMVHQPSGGFRGQASDIERHAEDIIKTKRRLNEIYAKHTGQPYEEVEKTLDRDHFMTAEEAKDWGIVDHVYETRDAAEGCEGLGASSAQREFGRDRRSRRSGPGRPARRALSAELALEHPVAVLVGDLQHLVVAGGVAIGGGQPHVVAEHLAQAARPSPAPRQLGADERRR